MPANRAYSYVRFSERRQKQGDSVRRQLELTRLYCERNGLLLDESLRLTDEGVSAWKGKNHAVGKLAGFLAMVEGGRIPMGSVLIVESLDRLTREAIFDALGLFNRILTAGVTIVTLSPEREYTRESVNDIAGLLEPIVYMSRANEESKTKSKRIKASWTQKRKAVEKGEALSGSLPWWLEVREGKFVTIPERVEVVRLIYRLRCEGKGVTTIVQTLNRAGIKSPRGGTWGFSTVDHLLRSRTVLGERQQSEVVEGVRVPVGDPVPNYYPAIVDLDTYHGAQRTRPKVGRNTGESEIQNIFKGLLYSALDGQPLYSRVNVIKSGKKVFKYQKLRSAGVVNGIPNADPVSLDYLAFERGFLSAVRELDPADFAERDRSGVAAEAALVSGRLAETEHKIASVKKRYKETGTDALLDLLGELDAERKALTAQLEGLQDRLTDHRTEAVGELQSLAELLGKATDDEANELRNRIKGRLAALVSRIELRVYPLSNEWKRANGINLQRNAALAVVGVRFHNGCRRTFLLDHEGRLVSPSYLVDQGGGLIGKELPKELADLIG